MFSLRSSNRRCSVRKGVLINFANFTRKHLYCINNFEEFLLNIEELRRISGNDCFCSLFLVVIITTRFFMSRFKLKQLRNGGAKVFIVFCIFLRIITFFIFSILSLDQNLVKLENRIDNPRVTKTIYKIKLRIMTSQTELLTLKFYFLFDFSSQ